MKKFPALTEQIRTGVVQFGDDWPGLFIRGDEALAFAREIELARSSGIDPAPIIDRLIALLRACDVKEA